MRKRFAGLLLVLPLVAACAQAAQPPAVPPGPPPLIQTEQQKQTAQCDPGKEQWRAQGTPKRGGILIRASDPVDHLDFSATGRHALSHIPQMYNGLLENRSCYYGDTGLRPVLAKSWEVSPDGLTYTFKLRDDVKWHNKQPVNGRAFTADDVVWTVGHQLAGGLLKSYWDGATVEAVDPVTVRVRLKQPDADFLAKVGYHQNTMFPREVKEQYKDFKTVAVGTGAYMLKDFKGAQETTLEPNPNGWEQGADGKPLPYLDGVRTLVFPDLVGQIAALRTGQLDTSGTFGLTKRDADQMRQTNPGLRYYPQFVLSFQGVWFNLKKKPFDNQKVRQAVSLAMDREDLFVSLGGPDAAIYASFVPPFLTDFAWSQDKAKQKYKRDLEGAKKLMAEAGVAPGDLSGLVMRTAGQYQQEAEAVQKQLQAIGIQAKLDIDAVTFSAILQKGDFDLAWGAYSGGPFANFWVGDFLRSNSNQNFIKLNDPRLDELSIAQSKELDLAKRKQIIDQLHDRLYDLMPYAPAATNFYHHFITCKVKNAMLANPTYNTTIALQVWLDSAGC